MSNVLAARMPLVFVRMLALAGLSLAAVAADVSDAAAQPGEGMEAIQQMFSDPALQNYRLTSGNLDKFIRATNALKALEDEDIDIEDHVDMDDPENINIGEIAAAFDSEPRIKTAINGAGMTSREYDLTAGATWRSVSRRSRGGMKCRVSRQTAASNGPAGALSIRPSCSRIRAANGLVDILIVNAGIGYRF